MDGMKNIRYSYSRSQFVPHDALVLRLRELAQAVTQGPDALRRECTMRIPAEPDRDADLVLSEAANRLKRLASLEAENARLREALHNCVALLDFISPISPKEVDMTLVNDARRAAQTAMGSVKRQPAVVTRPASEDDGEHDGGGHGAPV